MILPFQFDRIPQAIGLVLARRRGWSPGGQRVALRFDESGDAKLFGRELHGVIREAVSDANGVLSDALVELDRPLDYDGHFIHRGIDRVVTRPYLLWHGLARLLVTSAAVRVFDAGDLTNADADRIVGLATMRRLR